MAPSVSFKFDEVGIWSELKLEIVEKYGAAYTRAFAKQRGLKKCYVDAFSGAGVHISERSGDQIEGSPARALKTTPSFDGFVEKKGLSGTIAPIICGPDEPLAAGAERLFPQMLLKNPLGDLPNEVFVVFGSSDEEPFDLVIRCVRGFFRAALPQILGGSVVSHDHALLSRPRGPPPSPAQNDLVLTRQHHDRHCHHCLRSKTRLRDTSLL
jgi:hypothetical protein